MREDGLNSTVDQAVGDSFNGAAGGRLRSDLIPEAGDRSGRNAAVERIGHRVRDRQIDERAGAAGTAGKIRERSDFTRGVDAEDRVTAEEIAVRNTGQMPVGIKDRVARAAFGRENRKKDGSECLLCVGVPDTDPAQLDVLVARSGVDDIGHLLNGNSRDALIVDLQQHGHFTRARKRTTGCQWLSYR